MKPLWYKQEASLLFQTNTSGQHARDSGHRLRRVRGHLRRQERLRPPFRLQCVQSVPRGSLLPGQ